MKNFTFLALALCAILAVSCNNKTTKKDKAEMTKEVVETTKTAITEDVMATIDELAKVFQTSDPDVFKNLNKNLTEDEKLVKPDFLLNPQETKDLNTKDQKITALAILIIDSQIAKAYNMPTNEYSQAIVRLAAELNHPITDEAKSMPMKERILNIYNKCKEVGELPYFWKLMYMSQNEILFIVSQNPDLYLRNMSEEMYLSFFNRWVSCSKAIETLAKYDDELSIILNVHKIFFHKPIEEVKPKFSTLEITKKTLLEDSSKFKQIREAMLN